MFQHKVHTNNQHCTYHQHTQGGAIAFSDYVARLETALTTEMRVVKAGQGCASIPNGEEVKVTLFIY